MFTGRDGITGLILAGGEGQRVGGGGKALLPLDGCSLLEHVRRRLEPQTCGIMLAVHGDREALIPFCGECTVVVDSRIPRQGPMAGLEAALKTVTTDWLLSVPVDVPFFPMDLAQRLFSETEGGESPVIAVNRGREHPVIALWPKNIVEKITMALDNNDRGLKYFLRCVPHVTVTFSDENNGVDPFFNINTREDLQWAEQWLNGLVMKPG
ncbi:MAG: molybdenum cofactor guanylyltransferase [Nitrospirae bacterium]|nr:molybdenum cofactor guanylyltransferase [Magnetococcales bacterium]